MITCSLIYDINVNYQSVILSRNCEPELAKVKQPAKDLIHKIERAKLVAGNFSAARAPSVRSLVFTDPIRFIAGQNVTAVTSFVPGRTAIRRKTRRYDDRVL